MSNNTTKRPTAVLPLVPASRVSETTKSPSPSQALQVAAPPAFSQGPAQGPAQRHFHILGTTQKPVSNSILRESCYRTAFSSVPYVPTRTKDHREVPPKPYISTLSRDHTDPFLLRPPQSELSQPSQVSVLPELQLHDAPSQLQVSHLHTHSLLTHVEDKIFAQRQSRLLTLTPDERTLQSAWAQRKIQEAGACPTGKAFAEISEGYRCVGGMETHFMSHDQLSSLNGGFYMREYSGWHSLPVEPVEIIAVDGFWWIGPFYASPKTLAAVRRMKERGLVPKDHGMVAKKGRLGPKPTLREMYEREMIRNYKLFQTESAESSSP